MVNRLFKESLYLRRMKVHRDDAVDACRLDAVRANSGTDGNARLVLLVTLCIGKIRDNCGYGVCAGSFKGIDPEQQFNKLVIRLAADGLNNVNVLVADGFIDAHEDISFAELDGLRVAKLCSEIGAHLFGKRLARASGKYLDNSRTRVHLFFLFPQNVMFRRPRRSLQPHYIRGCDGSQHNMAGVPEFVRLFCKSRILLRTYGANSFYRRLGWSMLCRKRSA